MTLLRLLTAFFSLAAISAGAQSFYANGHVVVLPDGTYRDLTIGASGRGNGVELWCPTTGQWTLYKVPAAVSISGVADNGSGGVRITHAGTRPLITGQWLTMRGITGVTTVPYGLNALDNPTAAGAKRIAVINATQFDVDGFAFSGGTYAGGGVIDPVVAAHVNAITINGVPNQYLPETLTAHLVGMRYVDVDCTIAEMVLDSVRSGPWADYVNLNKDPETGLNLLPSYEKVPLVGMVTRSPLRHVQGNANSIFTLSWYNQEPLRIVASYKGNTGGAVNVDVPMAPYIADGRLAWLTWRGRLQNVKGVLHVSSTAAADITATITISRGGGSTLMAKSFTIRHDANGIKQLAVSVRIPADLGIAGGGDNIYFADLTLRTTAGTATLMLPDNNWLGGISSDLEVATYY